MRSPAGAAIALFAAIIVCLAGAPALAGVVLSDKSGDTTSISGGKIRSVLLDEEGVESVSILDAEKGVIIIIDRGRGQYISGSVESICAEAKSAREEIMKDMPPEAREMMEQMTENHVPPRVTVRAAGAGGKVAGYDTVKYEVLADGAPYGEAWLTRDPALLGEFGSKMGKLNEMSSRLSACMSEGMGAAGMAPEDSPAYMELEREGIILRETLEGETITDVVKIERREIPGSEFEAPHGYRKITFKEMMMGGGE